MEPLDRVQQNLLETLNVVETRLLTSVKERGTAITQAAVQMDSLHETSEEFYNETLPGWKRYIRTWKPPSWWFAKCKCCHRRKGL